MPVSCPTTLDQGRDVLHEFVWQFLLAKHAGRHR